MSANVWPVIFGLVGLGSAWYIYQRVKDFPEGEAKVAEIAEQIHLGAMVFMRREYTMLAWFCLVLLVLLFFSPGLGFSTALAFLVGALCSAGAGYIGMSIAVRANTRTTVKPPIRIGPESDALRVAFNSGADNGAYRSLGPSACIGHRRRSTWIFQDDPHTAHHIARLRLWRVVHRAVRAGLEAASTPRAADVGADLVGKIEAGHPRGRSRATPQPSRTTWATTWATLQAWAPTCSSPTVGSIIATITLASTVGAGRARHGRAVRASTR